MKVMAIAIIAVMAFTVLYFNKHGAEGLQAPNLVLFILTLSLIPKASGHVWLADGAGRDFGGFDYSKGNADVITLVLFLYGETQYVWVFWNSMFLMYDWSWVRTAIRVHFVASAFMVLMVHAFWGLVKDYARIQPPANNAKRPGRYLWYFELILSALFSFL